MMGSSSTPNSRDTIGTRKRGSDWLELAVLAFYAGWLGLAVYLVEFR